MDDKELERLQRKALGERLKGFRERAGLTQAELGAAVGVHGNTVNKWEKGRQGFHGDNMAALADALGVTVEELRGVAANGVSRETLTENQDPLRTINAELLRVAATDPARLREVVDLLMSPQVRPLWDQGKG